MTARLAVEDFEPFATPVPFKDGGSDFEPLGNIPPERAGLHFRQGFVRSAKTCSHGFSRP